MPGLPITRWVAILSLVLLATLSTTPLLARDPKPSKYPLRIHVLASDSSYQTPRMSPGEAAACDNVDGILSTISPNPYGPVSLTGLYGDPCSVHADIVSGRLFDVQYDPIYSGTGRADLVSPPARTQGFTFHYDDCTRVRVHPGFQSLPARWKKPGRQLEVLIPSDAIPVNGRELKPVRCTFTVTLHDFVYLLLRNGTLIQVSQEAYWKRPELRIFLSGNIQTIQDRTKEFTVPASSIN